MKKRWKSFLITLLLILSVTGEQMVFSQTKTDSLTMITSSGKVIHASGDTTFVKTDTSVVVGDTLLAGKREFKPNPKMAVILSAAFPGLGQIYNRKYWKLPFLYGGFLGFSYAISWNNKYYQDYSSGYKSIADEDPETNDWQKLLPYGQDPGSIDETWFKDVLKRRKDYYRRYRDLSIIGAVALYGLAIVDAYVDAQLFDFDISQDLSLRVEPIIIQRNNYHVENAFGVQLSFNFN